MTPREPVTGLLQRAIRRGIALDAKPPQPRLEGDERSGIDEVRVPPPAEPETPSTVRPSSTMRRIARASLQALRPLLAPLLYRWEWRVRTAVDKSLSGGSGIAWLKETLQAQQRQLTELQNELLTTNELLGLLRVSFDASHLGHQIDTADVLQAIGRAEHAIATRGDQLLQRRVVPVGDELLIRSLDGWLLVPREDVDLVMAMAETAGQLEPGTRQIILGLLVPGAVMIDVGANIGSLTLAAAQIIGQPGRVIALEPAPRTVALLRRNVALNGLDERVVVYGCAAGTEVGRATLNMVSCLSHSSLLPLPGTTSTVEVDVQPIDALIPAGSRVDVVKIDAEGSELAVWRGMRRVIDENPQLAVIMELGPSHLSRAGVSLSAWLAELSSLGFIAWEIEATLGCLMPLQALEELAKIHSVNLLLLRNAPPSHMQIKGSGSEITIRNA